MTGSTLVVLLGAIALIALLAFVLTRSRRYPPMDLADVDRRALIEEMEAVLEASEQWPVALSDGSVTLASATGVFPVRAVRYQVEADVDFERAVDYVKGLCDCGETMKQKPDKIEETLYDKGRGGDDHEWVRRSVHVSPPPGSNRDATVLYFQDRPAPKVYRIGFRSVDSIDGQPIEPWERASRFTVHPAIYRVDEPAPGRVRIRKLEAVDPQGMVSPLLNDYFISIRFFRRYMFEEAKAMRDALVA